jgi:glycopeptide antibiotics resistance protein
MGSSRFIRPDFSKGSARRWTRSTYALAALLYAAFVVYGSLVPLNFHAVAPEEAFRHFQSVVFGPLLIASRGDVATNVLLFVPLGYLLVAALRTDRSSWFGHVAAVLVVAVFGAASSATIEFSQIFFPRTVALSDILAESTGGAAGAFLWLVAGPTVTGWLRAFAAERERPALLQQLLLAYCVVFVFCQLLPFDLTVGLSELAQKYRQGSIIIRPFGFTHASWISASWDYFSDVVLNAPIGAAATLVWTEPGSRRRPLRAFVIAVTTVGAIELGQLFVLSRFADVTDVITGSFGAAIGIWAAGRLSSRQISIALGDETRFLTRLARWAIPAWCAVLLAYHWSPYNFSFAPSQVSVGIQRITMIPLLSYYWGTEFHAFTEMSRKALLTVPLGVLTAYAAAPLSRLRVAAVLAASFAFLVGIEVGQVFLPSRVPDVTDAVIGEIGIVAGMWVAGLMAAPSRGQRRATGDARQTMTG